jgi:branched-chain amino acid transport system substrate-binding protein
VQGVKAGVHLAKRDGYDLKYVVGDTATSPTTALSAGQSLVEQHHVLA